MEASEISADNYPIGGGKIICLFSVDKVKKLPKGTKLFSVGGGEVTTGKDKLDLDTNVFKRSKYGELKKPSIVKGKLQRVSKKAKTKNRS